MRGDATPVQTAALLMGLRAKGETAEEVAGAAAALRNAMVRLNTADGDGMVDTCGTGGGRVGTLNLSTAAAFVVAGAGVRVAKHGNRSFTSRSGSADVLEALGIEISLAPERASEVLQAAGIVFLFAPTYHPAMRHVGPVRKELAVPTIMNLLGPLVNPAGVRRQVIGVSDRNACATRGGSADPARYAARARAPRGRRDGRSQSVRTYARVGGAGGSASMNGRSIPGAPDCTRTIWRDLPGESRPRTRG